MSASRLLLGSLLATLLLACGGGATPPAVPAPEPPATGATPPTAPTGAPTAPASTTTPPASTTSPPAAAAMDWDSMTHEQKLDHMKKVVLPKMKAVFQAQDPKRFATVSCATCHGDGAKNGTFAMPNPKLPVLTPGDNFKAHMQKSPEMTKFMMEKVKPEMASAIGEKPMDATGKGFGCKECHVFAK